MSKIFKDNCISCQQLGPLHTGYIAVSVCLYLAGWPHVMLSQGLVTFCLYYCWAGTRCTRYWPVLALINHASPSSIETLLEKVSSLYFL